MKLEYTDTMELKFITTSLKDWFGDLLEPIGFIWYKGIYYRPVGDVIQMFSAKKNLGGYINIGFNIEFKCNPLSQFYREGAMLLDLGGILWSRYPEMHADLRVYVRDFYGIVRAYVKDELIPWFEAGTDIEGALRVLWEYCRVRLQESRYSQPFTTEDVDKMFLRGKSTYIYPSIKAKNYEYAEKLLSLLDPEGIILSIQKNKEEEIRRGESPEWVEEKHKYSIGYFRLLWEAQKRLRSGDEQYFHDLFSVNEHAWDSLLGVLHPPKLRRERKS